MSFLSLKNPKQHRKSYDKWQGDQAKISQREQLLRLIDVALAQRQRTLEELCRYLQDTGYEVKRGKYVSASADGKSRFIRLNSLGEGYREADLLMGRHDGHSAGREQGRAKVFNLKQMVRTMNYLMEPFGI